MINSPSIIQEKKHGIFLLLGLQPTVIESQVILTCLAMIEEGVNIEIWSFCTSRKSFNEAQEQLSRWYSYDIKFSIFRWVRSGLPLSEFINAVILGYWLIRNKRKPVFIHCRTEYPAVVAILLKPFFEIKVIWDARGDSEAEFCFYIKELDKLKQILSPIALEQIRIRLLISKKFADRCLFVSESLRKLYFKEYNYNSVVIPCAAEKKYFFFDSELREVTRNRLFIGPNDVVFIYSGSTALWQCVDETIELIEDHLKKSTNHKAIVLTPDVEIFLNRFQTVYKNRIICCTVVLKEVNPYLNAADYAIFLRRNNSINKVASPVKFAEYCLAGLPIIMTDAVDQAFDYSIDIGNLVKYKFGEGLNIIKNISDTQRYEISSKSSMKLSRGKLMHSLSEIYKF